MKYVKEHKFLYKIESKVLKIIDNLKLHILRIKAQSIFPGTKSGYYEALFKNAPPRNIFFTILKNVQVRPHIPELHSIQIHLPSQSAATAMVQQQVTQTTTTQALHNTGGMMITSAPTRQLHTLMATSVASGHSSVSGTTTTATILDAKNLHGQQILGVHPQLVYAPSSTLNLQSVSSVLPAALLVGDEKSPSNSDSETENSDVDVDVWLRWVVSSLLIYKFWTEVAWLVLVGSWPVAVQCNFFTLVYIIFSYDFSCIQME